MLLIYFVSKFNINSLNQCQCPKCRLRFYLLFFLTSDCNNGYYGESCMVQCSKHCAGNNNSCHHIIGTCDLGCDTGYQGALCIQGEHDESHKQ